MEIGMNHLFIKSTPLLFRAFLIAVFAGIILIGCVKEDFKHKGYLVDASILIKGPGKDDAPYVYRNLKADWPSYSKVLLDPVIYFRKAELTKEGVPLKDLQRLANNFYVLLYKELDKDYEMVKALGSQTLRIQIALTDLQESRETVDTVTSVVPVGMAVSAKMEFIPGEPFFVGEATVEAKITDARTGQLLAASIDRRVDGYGIDGLVESWHDVNKILALWSKWLRFRLCKSRGERDCFRPE
jgi:hypothetical protein